MKLPQQKKTGVKNKTKQTMSHKTSITIHLEIIYEQPLCRHAPNKQKVEMESVTGPYSATAGDPGVYTLTI